MGSAARGAVSEGRSATAARHFRTRARPLPRVRAAVHSQEAVAGGAGTQLKAVDSLQTRGGYPRGTTQRGMGHGGRCIRWGRQAVGGVWVCCPAVPPPPPSPRASEGDKAQNPVEATQLLPHSGRRGGARTALHCPSDTHNHGTELAMKVVRQARLELSGGSTPDLLRPPCGDLRKKIAFLSLLAKDTDPLVPAKCLQAKRTCVRVLVVACVVVRPGGRGGGGGGGGCGRWRINTTAAATRWRLATVPSLGLCIQDPSRGSGEGFGCTRRPPAETWVASGGLNTATFPEA